MNSESKNVGKTDER